MDFMKMVHVEKKVIFIQSHFRRILTLKRLERDIHNDRQELASRR